MVGSVTASGLVVVAALASPAAAPPALLADGEMGRLPAGAFADFAALDATLLSKSSCSSSSSSSSENSSSSPFWWASGACLALL